jgi:hypothetical protein
MLGSPTEPLTDQAINAAPTSTAPGKTTYAAATANRTVSLPGFMLFLAAQSFLEHPGTTPTAPLNPSRAGVAPAVAPDTHVDAFTEFVRTHLQVLVSYLSMGTQNRIYAADLPELRLLFREWEGGVETPFGTKLGFLMRQPGPTVVGAQAASATIELSQLLSLVRARLAAPGAVATTQGPGPAGTLQLYRGVSHQTVVALSGAPRCNDVHATVRLQRCTQGTFYLLQPLPTVVVSRCTSCTIILGPVAGALVLDRCEQCHVVATCAGVVLLNCTQVTLNVCCNAPPIVVDVEGATAAGADDAAGREAQGSGVFIGPYNTHYPALEEHCREARVYPRLNLFAERNRNDSRWRGETRQGRGPWSIAVLPPASFTPIVIPPFEGWGAAALTRTNPTPVPPEYAAAVQDRVASCKETVRRLQQAYATLEGSDRRDLADSLRGKVQSAFLEWLEATGQAQGLAELLSAAPPTPAATSLTRPTSMGRK